MSSSPSEIVEIPTVMMPENSNNATAPAASATQPEKDAWKVVGSPARRASINPIDPEDLTRRVREKSISAAIPAGSPAQAPPGLFVRTFLLIIMIVRRCSFQSTRSYSD